MPQPSGFPEAAGATADSCALGRLLSEDHPDSLALSSNSSRSDNVRDASPSLHLSSQPFYQGNRIDISWDCAMKYYLYRSEIAVILLNFIRPFIPDSRRYDYLPFARHLEMSNSLG
jgi:hypothetical protein